MISVITPVLNNCNFIRDTIQSVMIQDYAAFEHIIVDGGSTDGTLDIIKEYRHLNWISEPDKGQSDAMNKGFKMSTGDIIVYLNADDYFLPGAFNAVIPYFAEGANFVVGKIRVQQQDGSCWINDACVEHEEMLRHWEPQAFCVNPVGYFYRREVQEQVGGFNVENHYTMDLEFLLECSTKYSFTKMNNDQILGVFRNLKNTKTEKAMSAIKPFWSEENFSFINRFLSEMTEQDAMEFKRERKKAYKMRTLAYRMESSGADSMGSFWLRLKMFFLSAKKVSLVINFLRKS